MNKVSKFSIKLGSDLVFAQLGLIFLVLILALLDSGPLRWKVREMPWPLPSSSPPASHSCIPWPIPATAADVRAPETPPAGGSFALCLPLSPMLTHPCTQSGKAEGGRMYMRT